MDCQSCDSSLLDALYGEHDASAMDEHAAGCPACRARLAQLTRTLELVRPVLTEPAPEGLEARILAAADGVMAAPARPVLATSSNDAIIDFATRKAAALPRAPKERGGVVAFLARPQFAIAAAFL